MDRRLQWIQDWKARPREAGRPVVPVEHLIRIDRSPQPLLVTNEPSKPENRKRLSSSEPSSGRNKEVLK